MVLKASFLVEVYISQIDRTDWAGHAILADTLLYAEKKYTPSLIMNMASYTGECRAKKNHLFRTKHKKNSENEILGMIEQLRTGHVEEGTFSERKILEKGNAGKETFWFMLLDILGKGNFTFVV